MPSGPPQPAGTEPSHRQPIGVSALLLKLIRRLPARPLFLAALGFAAGCIVSLHAQIWSGAGLLILLAAVALLWRAKTSLGITCAVAMIGLGLGTLRAGAVSSDTPFLQPEIQQRLCTVTGTVATTPTLHPRSAMVLIDIDRITLGADRPQPVPGRRVIALLTGEAARSSLLDGLEPGDTVSVDGILSSADAESGQANSWRNWLMVQGIVGELRVRQREAITFVSSGTGNPLARLAARLRRRSDAILAASLSHADAAAAGAILLGERADLPASLSSAFVATGTVHLLATAGLHVGILVMVMRYLMTCLTFPRKWMALSGIALVWLYALMAGDRPAVVRAACVASLYFAAILLERIPDLLSALSVCALAMMWFNPRIVADPGFQLSFVTVVGIIALMPALMQVWDDLLSNMQEGKPKRWLHRILEVESLSVAAQASSAPLVAIYFNVVTIYGIGANCIAVPLMFVLMPAALLTLLLGAIWLPAGIALGHDVLAPVLRLEIVVVSAIAGLPRCAVSVPTPATWQIAIYYAALFGGSLAAHAYAADAKKRRDLLRDGAAAAEPARLGSPAELDEPAPVGR